MSWLDKLLRNLIKFPINWLVKTSSIPDTIESELGIDKSKPILYLLRTRSVSDQLALKLSTEKLGLPSPIGHMEIEDKSYENCFYLNKPQSLFSSKIEKTDVDEYFEQMFHLHRKNTELDIQIVPVSVFWGRAPGRASSGWSDLFADRASPSWLRKFFIVLFLGRDNFVCYSKAVSSKQVVNLSGSDKDMAHKLIRLAGTHFHRRHADVIGPNLLERQDLYNAILGAQYVKRAIFEEAEDKQLSHSKAQVLAKKYIDEIAADYRDGLIRLADRILSRVWRKIYSGVEVRHAEKVRELAQNGHEIIYVPCHRSHMDYLLLTYVIYHQGLVTPHIAAGINLNFWPAGVIFRRAGAFFLRRSFAGNKLYMAVFREYLQLLFKKGYPVKYYAEGGRSRTGRLLPPKTGMLSMTLQAIIKGNSRPVSLVPVYIGYEHVMEVATYQKELRGSKKKKESTRGIFSAIRKLKNYGFGYLNFGEPIQLHNFLDAQVPDWRETKEEDPSKKPVWLTPTVNALASRIMNRINQAAAVNGVALSALCLLSAKKHVMTKEELIQTVEHYQQLLKQAPYSKLATFPEKKASEVIEHTLSLNKIDVRQDSFGEVVSLSPQNAILLTYYRNTILHLFAVPGLLAAILFAKSRISRDELVDVLSQLYPLVQRELFIHMDSEQVKVHANMQIDAMLGIGMIHLHGEDSGSLVLPEARENTFYSLWLLNRCIQETTQRYALVLTLVTGCKGVSRSSLEKQSAQLAERFSALYGISSPEFFDKNVLSTFIVSLRENGYLEVDEQGLFSANQNTQGLYDVVVSLIAPDMAQHVQRLIPQLDTDKSTA